ncbi:hypothetical protein AB0302_04445 [Micrococcus sp. NPDC078436]|uniref:hypothetical protein n=1 Tax=Micrococcus sp. NPDC078436 TaxID=3154960 RepID=UPI00344E3968
MTDQLHLVGAPSWEASRVDLLAASSRTEDWIFELVHARTNRFIRRIAGVRGFEAEFNLHATIRSGGSCVWQGDEPVDWASHRLRAHYRIQSRGQAMQWTVGTFIAQTPKRTLTDQSRGALELQLFDAMARLEWQTSTAGQWVAHKGANIIATARALLDSQGVPHAIEDSPLVFSAPMVWKTGTTLLRMVNDMLAAANFFSIWADPQGVLRSGPHRPPAYRGVAFRFRADGTGLGYLPEIVHEQDTASVPSQLTLVATSDDPDVVPATATARHAPGSPFSFETRGYHVSVTEDAPGADPAVLPERAARRLEERSRPASTYEFQHLIAPLAPNDVVGLARARHGIDALAVMEKTKFGQDSEGLATTTVREVAA